MRYRKLAAPDNDFSFGNSALDYEVNTPEAVGLAVESGLMLFLGEWYLDTSLGTPWIEGALGKFSQSTADATIQNQVLNTQGVVDIQTYASQLDAQTRELSVQMTINTLYGPTEVQISNYTLF